MEKIIANVVIRDKEGKYLLQMRDSKAPTFPLQWVFFGGLIEKEEEPLSAAMRELEEELGVVSQASDFEKVIRVEDFRETKIRHLAFYTPRVQWKDIEVNEGAGAGFFTKEEILQIPSTEGTKYVTKEYLS